MADDAALSAYERDFYEWTQAQAQALRARKAGANALDYDNLAEEIEDLGKAEKNAVASNVRRVLEHLYKLAATQNDEPKSHWKLEITNFRIDAEPHITKSILRIVEGEMEKLHSRAARVAQQSMDIHEPGVTIDTGLRWSLAEVLDEDADPIALAAR